MQLLELLEDRSGDPEVVLEAATSLAHILQIAPNPTLKALDKHDAVTMLAYVIKRQQQLDNGMVQVHFLSVHLVVSRPCPGMHMLPWHWTKQSSPRWQHSPTLVVTSFCMNLPQTDVSDSMAAGTLAGNHTDTEGMSLIAHLAIVGSIREAQ